MRIAIISTMADVENTISTFIDYHISIGITDFIIFLDNPDEKNTINILAKYANVKVFLNDYDLQKKWKSCQLYNENKQYLKTEFRAKQALNTELGIRYAIETNIDWVLHIDIDEAFYIYGNSIIDHFSKMEKDKNYIINYENYESLQHKFETDNYFKDVIYFKKNPKSFNLSLLNQDQIRFIKNQPNLPNDLFFYYGNGKSAAKVYPSLLPDGPHLFQSKSHSDIFHSDCAIILHYPICSFNDFYLKYKRLGAFSDKWFGKHNIAEYLGQFHLDSRDVFLKSDLNLLKTFYRERVLFDDETVIKTGIDLNIFTKINFVKDRVKRLNG